MDMWENVVEIWAQEAKDKNKKSRISFELAGNRFHSFIIELDDEYSNLRRAN